MCKCQNRSSQKKNKKNVIQYMLEYPRKRRSLELSCKHVFFRRKFVWNIHDRDRNSTFLDPHLIPQIQTRWRILHFASTRNFSYKLSLENRWITFYLTIIWIIASHTALTVASKSQRKAFSWTLHEIRIYIYKSVTNMISPN